MPSAVLEASPSEEASAGAGGGAATGNFDSGGKSSGGEWLQRAGLTARCAESRACMACCCYGASWPNGKACHTVNVRLLPPPSALYHCLGSSLPTYPAGTSRGESNLTDSALSGGYVPARISGSGDGGGNAGDASGGDGEQRQSLSHKLRKSISGKRGKLQRINTL